MIKKLKRAYIRFKSHPLTKQNSLFLFIRYYIWFNCVTFFKNEIVIDWIGKIKLIIRKGDAGLVGNYYYGLHEFEDSIFLLHFVKNTDTFVDVGSNLGHYSLLLSGIKKCNSIAVEPVPNTFNQLKKIVSLNKLNHLITLFNLGVSNKEDKLFFSTDKGTMNKVVFENYPARQLVHVNKLDTICKDFQVNVLKIDVEGYEKYVLEGADNILKNKELKILMLEINNSGKYLGISDKEIYNTVLSYGFKPFQYNPEKREIRILSSHNKSSFNTIFMRDEDFVLDRIKQSETVKVRNKVF